MYPIVQFAPMHPTNLVNLDSDAATLKLARQTVWGQNSMSKWAPVNGLCLAWPAQPRAGESFRRALLYFIRDSPYIT
jgi:hypothetical protein